MAHIFQRIFHRLVCGGTSEERLRRERVREERTRWIAQELARREQERRARGEELLRGLPPVQGLGPGGRLGTIYTSDEAQSIMNRIEETAQVGGRRVSLRVLLADGTWHDAFVERGRRAERRVTAGFLCTLVHTHAGGSLGVWLAGGCTGMPGFSGEFILDDIIGYQLIETAAWIPTP